MSDSLSTFVWFATVSVIALWIAIRRGFFRVGEVDSSQVTIWKLLGGALVFFGLGYFSGMIGFLVLLAYVWLVLKAAPWGSGRFWPSVGIGAITWLVAFPVASSVAQAVDLIFQLPHIEQVAVGDMRALLGQPWLFALAALMAVIVVPVAEELLFRGLLQGWLSRWLPGWWAVVIASAVFAAAHYAPSQGATNITIIAQLFTFSLFLGHLYRRQRSLWASISLHATFNAIALIGIVVVDAFDLSV